VEECTTCFTHRYYAATQTCLKDFLAYIAVEIADLQARGNVPNVQKGNIGELTSPASGNADSTEECAELVAESHPAVEACVGKFPDTVHTVCSFRLSEDILECDLEMVVKTIGISVN